MSFRGFLKPRTDFRGSDPFPTDSVQEQSGPRPESVTKPIDSDFNAPRVNCARLSLVFIAFFATLTTVTVPDISFAQEDILKKFTKESITLPTDIPSEISAQKSEISKDGSMTVSGNVTFAMGNLRLRADKLTYRHDTGELKAEGKVIVRVAGDVMEAESIAVKLPATTGVIYNGKLLLTRNNIYLEGKKLEKTGDSSYHIEEGSFTTCNGANPDWKIKGKDLDVTIEGYGRLRHGFLYVKGIPVFYVPWMIYPAKRTRQSGLLMPTFANSSLRGFDLRFPLFLNFSPSVDATVVPRICTNRAAQIGTELRYFPYEDFQGRLYGEYTYDWKYGSPTNPKSSRFYLTWRHDQDFDGQLRLKVNGSWVSDRDYFEFWGGRFDKRLRIRYLESNAVAYRQFNNFLVLAEARHFDNLDLPDNSVTVQNLPIINTTAFNQQIPYTPFYFGSQMNFSHFYAPTRDKQWFGSRLRMEAKLSLPLALGRYLKIETVNNLLPQGVCCGLFSKR